MDTYQEIIEAVQSDLNVGNESTLMSLVAVKLAINRAYINKVSALFKWPHTEDAKLTKTRSNQEYYPYPTGWRPNSIWKLKVDSVDYKDPLAFKDYEYEKENDYPSARERIWSNKALKYFIAPVPTENNLSIEVHGQKIPSKLVSPSDLTIFSYNMPECNEAIVLEAVAILRSKGKDRDSSQFASQEAKQILVTAWGKLRQEQAKYEKTMPMFNVPDMFGKNVSSQRIGNF